MRTSQVVSLMVAICFFCSPFLSGEPIWDSEKNVPLKDGRMQKIHSLFSDEVEIKVNSFKSNAVNHETPDLGATFEAATNWMTGVNWGAAAFNGSISLGPHFFTSTLGAGDYVPVEIIFSSSVTTLCQTFKREASYIPGGVGTFPGAAYDISDPLNPRRLNICFAEHASVGANLIWDPSSSPSGKREYLFIMNSDYDGTGTTYASSNILTGPVDVLYGWWPRVSTGSTLLENEPATLTITPHYVKNFYHIPISETEVNLRWNFVGSGSIAKYRILRDIVDPPMALFDSLVGSDYNDATLASGTTYYYQIEAFDSADSLITKSKVLSLEGSVNSFNINFIGAWNKRSLYGDSWGYVDGANEYALICARNEGVSIIDLNSLPYTEVSFLESDNPGTDAKDIKIYQNYAIMVMESAPIEIYDLTNISAPVQVSIIVPSGGSAHNCAVYGDYLYVIGNHGIGGVEIFDISNPASPVKTGEYATYYYHDVDFYGNYMFACAIWGEGIDIIDISDKSSPTYVTTFNYSGSGAHNIAISLDGNYAFVGDEIGPAGNHTRVFDISDFNNISYIDNYIVNPAAPVHNCYTKDNFLYIAHYSEGFRVWNVVNPGNASEIAYFDTYPGSVNGYVGNWNVYPYLPSGKIILSDMQTGLYVVELDPLLTDSCFVQSPGDIDLDGDIGDNDDYTMLLNYLYNDGPAPLLLANADVNGDCKLNVGDLIHINEALTPVTCTCNEPLLDCCFGIRGNHNYDPNDKTDITDLTFFVSFFFKGGDAPFCIEESDVNGDSDLNIADLTYFVSYLFKGGFAPNNCN